MDVICSTHEKLVGKTKRKGPTGRLRSGLEYNIGTDRKEIGCEFVEWIYLAQDRDLRQGFVNTVMDPEFHKMR
jgi:hypothetical protein